MALWTPTYQTPWADWLANEALHMLTIILTLSLGVNYG